MRNSERRLVGVIVIQLLMMFVVYAGVTSDREHSIDDITTVIIENMQIYNDNLESLRDEMISW